MTFLEHKEATANDVEQVRQMLAEVVTAIQQGDLGAFERFWIEGGTPEGDGLVDKTRELLVLRYLHRTQQICA